MSFIHLHTHSNYSLLSGLSKINELVELAKSYEMKSLALTDHGNLYGAIPFYKKCIKEGIKPIIGIDAYIAEKSLGDKQPGPENRTFHLTLLAKNNAGYKNLIKLVTESHLNGFYHRPRMDKKNLTKYKDGLLALSGDIQGEIARALWNQDQEKARQVLDEYKKIFGEENFYIEIMHHPSIERHDEIMEELIKLGKHTKTPLVATAGAYYLKPEDKDAHRTLLAIQSNNYIGEEARYLNNDEDFSFIDTQKAESFFKEVPEAITNTEIIAEKCNVEIKSSGWLFPNINVAEGMTHEQQLTEYAYGGISHRNLKETKELKERLHYELDTINKKGFAPYFLVVSNIMHYARKHGILTTIRGSVAGSLVTYLIKITNVNPLEYDIPFERFLNPERPSAPDIDMDFADDRRDEVIEYAKEKYGEDKVAQIGTFGTMLARGVVRDVARALGYPYGVGDRIAKMIPFGSQGFPMTIDKAMKLSPDLKTAYEEEKDIKEIINMAKKLEGNPRHCSVHAAGVVISPIPLTELVPLQREPKGEKIITQYDMYVMEDDVGLLKFDFLGIRNLAILAKAVDLVKNTLGENIDIENIPLDDKKTFAMLGRGETMGLFQLGGTAMTNFLKDLKPSTVHDINAMVALYRPGPMKNIPEYIDRKHGKKPITYYHPKMKSFLDKSYGILVYQDDILSTAIGIAGYTWKTVDKLRKAIGKKIPEEMAKQHAIFVEGCKKKSGMTEREAEGLWELFEPFQGYGFNKAHAACYGRVAYQTAFMKANYPSEYMTAVLTAESGDTEEIAKIVSECKRMGIEVLPPDVQSSFGGFTVIKEPKGDKIRFGLYTIKNLGEEIANAIIDERKKSGVYKNFSDFLDRVKHNNLNRRSLEALMKSGALDALGERGEMLGNMEEILAHTRQNMQKQKDQDSLFIHMEDTTTLPVLRLKKADPAKKEDKLVWEKELLGLYISGHPLEKYKKRFDGKKTIKDLKEPPFGADVMAGGMIEEVRTVTTRRGERMAFVKLVDFDDSIEVIFFPSVFEQNKDLLVADNCVVIKGKTSFRRDTPGIIADKIKLL